MKTRNTCCTYFKIVGDFDPKEISAALGMAPDTYWKKGELRRNGTPHISSCWTVGSCTDYDVLTENQMKKTISLLSDKIPLLNRIREEQDVEFFLTIVPSIYVGEINPCLAPSLDIIDFCHATRTRMDMDLYIHDADDE